MAITDKVIELSPVNKKKNIIFYVIMGVLLATTVLFLLLFILKPAASAGEISGLELTSNLYKDGDAFIAAKGNAEKEYTLCAVVGYSGDDTLDTSLEWVLPAQFTRTNANEISESDMQEARRDATLSPDENTKVVYDYCKFKIDSNALSGNKATITVRTNAKDKEQNAFQTKTIEIEVRDVGARELEFTRVTTQANTPPAALTPSDEEGIDAVLRLPYINRPTSTSYNVYMEQIPEVDGTGREMPITVRLTNELSSSGSRYATNAILAETVGEQTAINLITPDSTASNAFSFGVNSVGTAVVKVTGNRYNGSPEITKTVKIIVNPIDAFDVVTGYKLMENAVDVNAENAPAGDGIDEIELLAATGTGRNAYDLQSHIAVTPWRLQKSWAGKNVSVSITDEKGQAIGNTIVRMGSNGQGITLEPLSPGTAYVTITDNSANSIGTTMRFKVNVRYDISRFGYGDRVAETHSVKVITGSERNELEVTYILTDKNAEVKPSEINAYLKVSGGKGIAFHDIVKGTTDVIAVTSRFVGYDERSHNVTMKATLYFDVDPDIGSAPVSFTLTPLGSTSDSQLTVTVEASVEATRFEFITEAEWNELKAEHIAKDPLLKYATYSVDASGNAVLSLNMSKTPGYYTQFVLSDLVKFFDASGNDASLSGYENTRVTLSDNYDQAFTLSGDTPSPLSKIAPAFDSDDRINNFKNASITFSLKDTTRKLTIVSIDTPLQLSYSGSPSSFSYGCPATDSSVLRNIAVLPASVTQTYASEAVRSPSRYYVSIHINTMNNELIQVDPLKFVDRDLITDAQIPYVYYFATEQSAAALENLAKTLTDQNSVDAFRQEARRTAMFAVKRSYNETPKEVHLLQDLYTTDYSSVGWEGGSKINQIRFRLYPCDENGTPDLSYAADDYAVTPVRIIDEIILSGNGIAAGENSYTAQATSGSRFTVVIGAKLYLGTADLSEPSGSKVYDYNIDDANLADVQQVSAECNSQSITFSSTANGHTFNMPVVQSNEEPKVVIKYTQNGKETTLVVTVHNRTLPVSGIKLFSDKEMLNEIADGGHVLLNTLIEPSAYDKIYYKINYTGNLSDFISYETVSFYYMDSHLGIAYEPIFPNNDNSIASGGGKFEFTGYITLNAKDNGTSDFYLQSDINKKKSSNVHMLGYTPASGIEMADTKTQDKFLSDDGRTDRVSMNIASAEDKPEKSWVLNRFLQEQNTGATGGGTSYEVLLREKGSSTGLVSDLLDWQYNASSRTLTLTSKGKVTEKPLSLEVVVTEYASHEDFKHQLNVFTIEFTVEVTASVYKNVLVIDGGSSFVTDGGAGEIERKLTATLNDGKPEHSPKSGDVTYKLYRGETDITNDVGGHFPFYLVEKSGEWYVGVKNSVFNLDYTYGVSAVADGVESEKVTLTLSTTAKHIAFTGAANVSDGGTYTSHDVSDTYNLSAEVRNSGTENVLEEALTYSVLQMDGNPFASGNEPASISGGILSFNDVGSASFKVVISSGSLTSLTVNFVLENAVTNIRTTFDGNTSTSGDITLSPVLFGGNSPTLGLRDITLVGKDGKKAYSGAVYEVVWTPNNGVFAYEESTKTITYVGVGKSSFTLRAETYPGSNVYIERTFTLEAVAPTFTAAFADGDTAQVNIMDITANKAFAFNPSSSTSGAVVASVAGDAITSGLFSYANNVLTLNYAAFASENLSSVKTYVFTVSATVGGVNASNTVKLYVRVSADKSYTDVLFKVVDTSGGSPVDVTGRTLKLINSGKYELDKISDSAISENFDYTVSGATLSDGQLTFTNVGSVVVSATYTKYGKKFDVGTLSFFVTNDGSQITSSLGIFEAVDGKHYVDYTTDKKTVTYTIDWSKSGRDFAGGDFTVHYNSNILSVSDVEYNTAAKTAKWTFTVNEVGTTTIFASSAKDGAYYASEEQSATFYASARPSADSFGVSSDRTNLDPAAPGNNSASLTPTFNAPANFAGDYKVEYAIVSGGDYVALGTLSANNEMPVTAKWTYGGGTARIRATLTVLNGYHKDTVIEKYIDITVTGATEGEFTLTQPATPVVLGVSGTYKIDATAEAGSGDTNAALKYEITSGSTYASVDAASGLVTADTSSGNGGTVTVKVTATFTRRSELGGGTYTEEGTITLYVAPTKLYSDKTNYNVTAGETVSFTKPYVNIDGTKTYVTSVTYAVSDNTLGSVNGETFVSVVGAGGIVSGGVSVTASVAAGVFSVQNLTLSGGYEVRVLGISAAGGTTPYVTADGNTLELNNSHIELSTSESVTGNVIALETDNADLLINGDDKSKLSVDIGTHRYFGDTAPANIPVKVKVRATGASGTYVGYITVNIVPRKVEVNCDTEEKSKSLKVGESFTVTYTINGEFTTDNSAITDVRMSAAHGTCLATKTLENNATKLVYTYTANSATQEGTSDKAVMKVEICGHVYTLGEIDVTVLSKPVIPTFTPNGELSGDVYTFNHTVTNEKDGTTPTYKYSIITGSEAIVGGAIAANASSFTVKHLKNKVDVVIEVTATITATDGGVHTLTERLEAIEVSAAPAPTFTSSAAKDGDTNNYNITNSVTNNTGAPTYSYRIISGSEAIVGGSIASGATSFTVQSCDDVVTVVIEVTALIPTSYGKEELKFTLEPITVPAKASSQLLSSSVKQGTGDASNEYTIENTVSKYEVTKYEYKVISGSEAIDGRITEVSSDKNKATFTVKPLDKDVYIVIEVTATVKINAFRTETHKATVGPILVAAVPPVFTSSIEKDSAENDKYNIANSVENIPSGATVEYSYRVLAGSAAIVGTLANNATSFTVEHLDYPVDIVIEVTATITESGKEPVVLKRVLEPVPVEEVPPVTPDPVFTSSFEQGEGTDENVYTITNTLENLPEGATVTYSYAVIAGSEAISGYTDETDNGITAGSDENAHKATFTAVPQSGDVVIYIKVTAAITSAAGGEAQTFTEYLEISIPASTVVGP